MTYDRYKEAFDRDGFVIVPQLVPQAEFAKLCANLERYIREVLPTLPATHAYYQDRGRPETLKQMQFMSVDPFFLAYGKHPTWRALAEALVGEEVEAMEPEWFDKPPGIEHKTPPHQDNYYFNLKPANVATIWMALDPVNAENGCLRYVAGSHQKGVRPHASSNVLGFSQGITDYGPKDEAREVLIHLQPGDVVAHHGVTIHRADPNRSATRHRRAFAMVFKGVSCRRDEEAFARYKAAVNTLHETVGIKA